MENLSIYQQVRSVPESAQKAIGGGRLKGMTDISPMWRIKTLTEQFGPCGFGWVADVVKCWIEEGYDGQRTANVEIALRVKIGDEWSAAICGIGGSMLVSAEKGGLYTDDECYKKAYTDAISVACKALGFGADIYWAADKTKYSEKPAPPALPICEACGGEIKPCRRSDGTIWASADIAGYTKRAKGQAMCYPCFKKCGQDGA